MVQTKPTTTTPEPITLPPQPTDEEKVQMTANEAEVEARFWRETARRALLNARDAINAAEAADDESERERLLKAAELAVQASAAAEAARQDLDQTALAKEAAQQAVERTQECSLTQGKSIDCLVGDWTVSLDDCSSECDGGGAVRQTRAITIKPMCGGDPCGSLVATSPCPVAPSCLFESPQAVRTTIVLSGVSPAVYDTNKEGVQTILKAHVRVNILGVGGPKFKLEFIALDSVAAAYPSGSMGARRRQRRAAEASDTELGIDIITDASEVELKAVEEKANAASAEALLEALGEVDEVKEHITDLFFEPKACTFDVVAACGAAECGWQEDSCGNTRWCGSCGLEAACFTAVQACLNGGDCSHMADVMDDKSTVDRCLLDTSQLQLP